MKEKNINVKLGKIEVEQACKIRKNEISSTEKQVGNKQLKTFLVSSI